MGQLKMAGGSCSSADVMLENCFLERHSPDIESGMASLLTPSGLLAEMRCGSLLLHCSIPCLVSTLSSASVSLMHDRLMTELRCRPFALWLVCGSMDSCRCYAHAGFSLRCKPASPQR